MASQWSRFTSWIRGTEKKQTDALGQMTPADRAAAEEGPGNRLQDERANEGLGGQPGSTRDPDDSSGLLDGPTS